ncbi:MAG: hypothetical protein NTY61_03895 [Candidatus Parcubacteria bacterium]|nr:hypothetical protein [Candidatus Parcubacteria bacterium]
MPGDVLRIEVDLLNMKLGMMKIHAVAKVDGQVAAEADLMCALINNEKAK